MQQPYVIDANLNTIAILTPRDGLVVKRWHRREWAARPDLTYIIARAVEFATSNPGMLAPFLSSVGEMGE
jgi:hypothetical protein